MLFLFFHKIQKNNLTRVKQLNLWLMFCIKFKNYSPEIKKNKYKKNKNIFSYKD